MSDQNLAEKLGFGLTDGFWNHFGVVLIEAPIQLVTSTLSKHFCAKCDVDIFPTLSEDQEKHFLWQYTGHSWTVWWAFSSEAIAFALALLLETKAIVITHQGTSSWSTLKVFI